MTAVLVAFAAGLLTGGIVCWPVARRRAFLVCQRQALVDNAPRPVIGFGYNPVPAQRRRRWLADRKPRVERQPEPLARPGFHY